MAMREGKESGGTLVDINLVDVLQVLSVNRKTCTLFLRKDNKKGEIYIKDGNIIDAKVDNLKGEDALFTLLDWSGADFFIGSSIEGQIEDRIKKDFHTLMLEWMDRKDTGTVEEEGAGPSKEEQICEEKTGEGTEEVETEAKEPKKEPVDETILSFLEGLEEAGIIKKEK